MAQLITWDEMKDRLYETGVDHGVLFLYDKVGKTATIGEGQSQKTYTCNYTGGVAWNGLTAVNHSPEGAEANDTYADNIKYITLRSAEDFKYTIEALYSPAEFDECDGTIKPIAGLKVGQQNRKMFGFYHRSNVGSAEEGIEYGHKHHFIWGCTADPTEHNYETVNDSPEPASLSWEVSTVTQPMGSVVINGTLTELKPTAHLEIDDTQLDAQGKANLAKLLEVVFGTKGETSASDVEAMLPSPMDVIDIMMTAAG